MLKFMREIEWWGWLMIVILVFMFVFVIADYLTAQPYTITGIVMGKEFQPAHKEPRTIIIDGKLIIIMVSVNAEWVLIISNDGEIDDFSVQQDIYYSVEIGDMASLQCIKGEVIGLVSCK